MNARRFASVLLASVALAGCGGGTNLVKQPAAVPASQPLASAADPALSARLDHVVVRNGPGTHGSVPKRPVAMESPHLKPVDAPRN